MENTFDEDDHLHLHLPQDVLIQILVLLPVISLLGFKSVCKSWCALIQSSLFIDLHLNNTLPPTSNNNKNFGTFILQTSNPISLGPRETNSFMLSGGGGGVGEVILEDLGFPPHYKVSQVFHDIFMVGSCNGLICIHDTKWKEVSLWNPATRQFRLLPKSLTIPGIEDLDQDVGIYPDFVAFGYDVKTKDYKVVQICRFKPYMSGDRWLSVKEYIFRVQVYSLSTDSWRLLEGINSLPAHPVQGSGRNHGVCLNGSYYFLGNYTFEIEIENVTQVRSHSLILSFDFTKEIFTTIQLPYDYHLTTILTYFGEKLAVFAMTEEGESDFEFYDIWVLNEHGVKESWTKLHLTVHIPYSYGIPKGISKNGEFALIATMDGSLINGVHVYPLKLFNLVTKEVKKEFPVGQKVIRADVYKQSLVSIGRNNTVADWVIGGTM